MGFEHQTFYGFAKETDDPAIVAATMAKPGVVLRRAVGSTVSFGEQAELPKDLGGNLSGASAQRTRRPQTPAPADEVDDKASGLAAAAFAREQRRRDSERRRQEAEASERKRREQVVANAEIALEEARRRHETKADEIAAERSALDRRAEVEENRWAKQKAKLDEAVLRARE